MNPARNFGQQWTAWRLRLALSVLALAILSIRALAAPGEAEQVKCGLCQAPSRVAQLLAKNGPVAASTSADSDKQPAPAASGPANIGWIPGGDFTIGTDENASYAPERPAHYVQGTRRSNHQSLATSRARPREYKRATSDHVKLNTHITWSGMFVAALMTMDSLGNRFPIAACP